MLSVPGYEDEDVEEEEEDEEDEEDNGEEEKYVDVNTEKKGDKSSSNINDHKLTPQGVENSFDIFALERKIPVSHQVLLIYMACYSFINQL